MRRLPGHGPPDIATQFRQLIFELRSNWDYRLKCFVRHFRYGLAYLRRVEFCSMGMITGREVGRFYAEDGKGNRYTVVRWQDMIVFRPSSGAVRRIPGKVR